MIPIVTCCNERYLPALKALHNSFLRNSAEGFEFYAITEGRDFSDHVRSMGIGVIEEPVFPAERYPVSERYPEPLPIFYARLLVPSLFQDRQRSIYIDTDSIILRNLQPLIDLDIGDKPVAATRSSSPMSIEFSGGRADKYGPMSSLYVFNHKAWAEKRILERCAAAMADDSVTFYTIAQGLLQYVLNGDWHELPWETQVHAGHSTWNQYPRARMYTLHFMGTNPWEEYVPQIIPTPLKLALRELWKTYAALQF